MFRGRSDLLLYKALFLNYVLRSSWLIFYVAPIQGSNYCTASTAGLLVDTSYVRTLISRNTHPPFVLAVDDHGEMRVDAQSWAAAAIETKSDEKEISRAIKVCRMNNLVGFLPPLESSCTNLQYYGEPY